MRPTLLLMLLVAAAGCGEDSDILSSTNEAAQTTPATVTTPADEPAEEEIRPIPQRDARAPGPHPELFFYFRDEDDARAAAAELEEHGYRVRTTPPADDIPEWSVIAEGTPDAPGLGSAEDAFRAWAKAHDGRYDGNEIPVGP